MSIGDVRDFVLVVWGIISILLTLVLLVLAAAILYFGRKGMKFVHRQLPERVQPALKRANDIAQKVQDRTARLPGAPGATGGVGELVGAVRSARESGPPFRSRRKTWLPFR